MLGEELGRSPRPLRLDAIEVRYVVLPLISPWRTAYGEDDAIHSVLVRMFSGAHQGWGETTPFYAPTYSPETAGSAYFLLTEHVAPRRVGREIESAPELRDILSPFKGNPCAKAGIETAWWMLLAQVEEKPLHQLLGGKSRRVDAGADFGVQESIDMLLEKIETAFGQGFKRIKLKVRPGWDLDMLRAVRSTCPKATFHPDCTSGYDLSALPFFKAVDELDLAMIEQPLHYNDLYDHAQLQRQIHTPICLDESIKSLRDFELALKLDSCKILNIKYTRVGGLLVAKRLHDLAQEHNITCWVGGMLESAIGAGIDIELATLDNFTYPNDLFPSQRFYRQDLTEPEVVLNPDCTFTPSSVPGTPYEPVMERVEAVTRHKKLIE